MPKKARQFHKAEVEYRGTLTRPERWGAWQPNEGDIIICTPAKCGTTWTQAIVNMLLYGRAELPGRISALSPWLDSALGDADPGTPTPISPSGRRAIKTHTPSDGFPVWHGVHLVAVYRHPLDVFLSIRKHVMNMKGVDNPDLCGPVPEALTYYLNGAYDIENIDRDYLVTLVYHYLRTLNRPHQTNLILLHYSNMVADHRGTVARLARALEIDHDDALIDAVTKATDIGAMRADAGTFAPEGGKGFWHKDAAFFDIGGARKWQGQLSDEEVDQFEARLCELLPDAEHASWLKYGK
ncbi:sulfotransferase domain-containing protein [uncultured Roseobacter sp.]|uniref:sulfotransferase domain-containing protein n=1 Tax=uncultured Roseobacter sp. TaxID=114847 RepID=UPI00260536B5|nr:sulfotransferase domain-containing protein [uncultured Roseobacter sp.]